MAVKLSEGIPDVHAIPVDLKKALVSDSKARELWESITPLARNEWICWVLTPQKQETRDNHVKRVVSELKDGMRRPCCWIGCIHRKDKKISSSVQWILARKNKKVETDKK